MTGGGEVGDVSLLRVIPFAVPIEQRLMEGDRIPEIFWALGTQERP